MKTVAWNSIFSPLFVVGRNFAERKEICAADHPRNSMNSRYPSASLSTFIREYLENDIGTCDVISRKFFYYRRWDDVGVWVTISCRYSGLSRRNSNFELRCKYHSAKCKFRGFCVFVAPAILRACGIEGCSCKLNLIWTVIEKRTSHVWNISLVVSWEYLFRSVRYFYFHLYDQSHNSNRANHFPLCDSLGLVCIVNY